MILIRNAAAGRALLAPLSLELEPGEQEWLTEAQLLAVAGMVQPKGPIEVLRAPFVMARGGTARPRPQEPKPAAATGNLNVILAAFDRRFGRLEKLIEGLPALVDERLSAHEPLVILEPPEAPAAAALRSVEPERVEVVVPDLAGAVGASGRLGAKETTAGRPDAAALDRLKKLAHGGK